MKTSSAKAKGRRLAQHTSEAILEHFPQLEADDVKVTPTSVPGTDLWLSPAARRLCPYSIECKNRETLSIWAALKQAEDNTRDGTAPLLVFSRNRLPEPYVALRLSDFLRLLTSAVNHDEEKSPPQEPAA